MLGSFWLVLGLYLNSAEVQTARLEERVIQLQASVAQVQGALGGLAAKEAESAKALTAYTTDRVNGPVARQDFERAIEAQRRDMKELETDLRLVGLLVKAAGMLIAAALVLAGWMKIRVKVGVE